MNKSLYFCFLFCLIIGAYSAPLQRYLITNPNAVCLDGTPGAYYILKGDPQKAVIFFQGGGWCGEPTLAGTTQSCYQRSSTNLGSSKDYPTTLNFGAGLLSMDEGNNFKDWTKIYFPYCDGAGHQGSRATPLEYKGKKLYFRGTDITVESLKGVEKEIGLLSTYQDIMVSGASAGGLAVYFWANYIRDNSKAKNVWAAPDSGIFLNEKDINGVYSYQQSFKNLLSLSNQVAPHPVTQCSTKYKDKLYLCMFAENLYPFLKVPIFNIQSQYDTWSVANILRITCISGSNLTPCSTTLHNTIEDYHRKTNNLLVAISSKNLNGAWAPVCANHCYTGYSGAQSVIFRIPANSIYSVNLSLKRWIDKVDDDMNHRRIEGGQWPENKPCSGLPNSLHIESLE